MRVLKRIKPVYQLLVYLCYLGIGFYLQKDIIQEFPHHIHAWAHSDHYALSKGFINNNFDFFHPQTLTEKKQFQSTNDPERLTNVTSADFPIVQFSAAVIMKVIGNEEPVVYRVLMLLIASLGLLYLFKISYHFSELSVFSLLAPILLLFSPVYLDYQVGFLPSMAALSFLFLGAYQYILYNDSNQTKYLSYAVIWLSLATLIRTPFAVPLIAIFGYHVLLAFKSKNNLKLAFIILAGFIVPVIYFLYNQYLRAEYGSIFLGSPLYPRNLEEFKINALEAYQNWHLHYFGKVQWTLISVTLLSLITLRTLTQNLKTRLKRLINIGLIYSIGVILYLILMSRQMVHHDYYSLDTFFPLFILITVVSISQFVKHNKIQYFGSFVLLGLIVLSLKSNLKLLTERRDPANSQPYTEMYEAYQQLDALLEKNNIDESSKLLVWDRYAPNMALLLSHHAGYCEFIPIKEYLEKSLNWPAEYIIVRSSYFNEVIYEAFPEVKNYTTLIDFDGEIMLLSKLETPKEVVTQVDWLGISSLPSKNINIDQLPENDSLVSGTNTYYSDNLYTATFKDTIFDNTYKLVELSLNLKKRFPDEAFWHVKIHSESDALFDEYLQIPVTAQTLTRSIILPQDNKKWFISAYIYNPNKNTIEYQDFKVTYY